jgi:hypothetical protein
MINFEAVFGGVAEFVRQAKALSKQCICFHSGFENMPDHLLSVGEIIAETVYQSHVRTSR